MGPYRLYLGTLLLLLLPTAAPSQALVQASLDVGYRDMYNLDFGAAHRVFESYSAARPQDPLGPVSDAAAYLFSEFDRLRILDIELFEDDTHFNSRSQPAANPDVKRSFENRATEADTRADRILTRNSNDANALYAKTLAAGLRSDYAAMIDKRDYTALKLTEQASKYAIRTLAADPHLYDAYLAIGVENYMLSLKPPPMKLFLYLRGDSINKEEGIRELQLTADKGHYLAPFARLMLAVAEVRDNQKQLARSLLLGLSREFPTNTLYQRQLARIH